MEAAQAVVASEIVSARGGIEANELAALLRVPVPRAEELIAAAQVDRMLSGGERLRVEEAPEPGESQAASTGAISTRKERAD